jgi:dGTPase
MTTRTETFEDRVRSWESEYLWDLATTSYPARRLEPEPDSPVRTPFQRDRDRIVHSKAFRRLKHKTQVFVAPEGDHYRTRLTHTLEACFISRTVARALGLNEDLTEAIGLGHDLGHPPFGHIGEEVLDEALREHGMRFRHNEHSLRVVDKLAGDGRGLNLTEAVRDGILNHTGPGKPATLEGRVVRIVDRVAYINHDIDDAVRAGIIFDGDLPAEEIELLGGAGRGGSICWFRTWCSGPGPRVTSRKARRSAGRCCGCGSSCSTGSTSGRRRGRSRRGRGQRCGPCSTTTWGISTRCRPLTRRRIRCNA